MGTGNKEGWGRARYFQTECVQARYSVAFLLAWYRTKWEWCMNSLHPYSFYRKMFQTMQNRGLNTCRKARMWCDDWRIFSVKLCSKLFLVSAGYSTSLSLSGDTVSLTVTQPLTVIRDGKPWGFIMISGQIPVSQNGMSSWGTISPHTPAEEKTFQFTNSKPPAGLTPITRFSSVFSSSSLSHGSLFTQIHYHEECSQPAGWKRALVTGLAKLAYPYIMLPVICELAN